MARQTGSTHTGGILGNKADLPWNAPVEWPQLFTVGAQWCLCAAECSWAVQETSALHCTLPHLQKHRRLLTDHLFILGFTLGTACGAHSLLYAHNFHKRTESKSCLVKVTFKRRGNACVNKHLIWFTVLLLLLKVKHLTLLQALTSVARSSCSTLVSSTSLILKKKKNHLPSWLLNVSQLSALHLYNGFIRAFVSENRGWC